MKDQRQYHRLRLHFDLIKHQRAAVKLCLNIFNELRDADVLGEISVLLDKANSAKTIEEVEEFIEKIKEVAKAANVNLPE